jgi:hypothetical protein
MRRIYKLSLLAIAAGAGACSTPDVLIPTEVLPYAGVRFINAVPDSSGAFGMDFRFIDLPESNAHYRVSFRNLPTTGAVSSLIQYKGAREGSRHFRVFLDDTIQAISSTVIVDTTVSLTKGHNYTAMMWGNGTTASTTPAGLGGDKMALAFWEETVTAPAAGKVKIRVINTTNAAIDVRPYAGSAAVVQTAAPPTGWAAIPAYSASPYIEVDTTAYMYNVRAAGSGTNLFADVRAVQGTAGVACKPGEKIDVDAGPGTRISGSAVSGIVFPRATAGSRAFAATSFATPGITYTWDLRPARSCDPYC